MGTCKSFAKCEMLFNVLDRAMHQESNGVADTLKI